MATFANSSGGHPAVDMTFLNELYEEIERRPPALEARKLIIQLCMEAGWIDTARDATGDLLALDPYDEDALGWADMLYEDKSTQSQSQNIPTPSVPISRSRSEMHIQNLTEDTDRCASPFVRASQLPSAQSVARAMEKIPTRAMDIAVEDLGDQTRWLRSQPDHQDNDAVRESLVKRVAIVSSALPDGMKRQVSMALMHVEHELLHRTYICDETMYGDKVADIPRARFLVTEDGYPWDMEELAQAIKSNGGVMRNPLSRQMFTTEDIRMILQHPLGKGLAALEVEQGQLSKGVRPKTIEELEKIAAVLVADMSGDQMESQHALDHFLGYMATLPESEQDALNGLHVSARDSHTGQGFDATIGEAVRDAKANVVCIHKIGDFLQQAVEHLKTSK